MAGLLKHIGKTNNWKDKGKCSTVCPELEWVRTADHLNVFITVKVTSQQGGRQSVF